MTLRATISILFLCLPAVDTGNYGRPCGTKATLSRAIQCCENLPGNHYLPTIISHVDKISVAKFIGEGETWVNLKLVINSEWKITGDRKIEFPFTKPDSKHNERKCGIVKKQFPYVYLVSCSQKVLGAICEYQNCESCISLGRFAYNCFTFGKRCYVVFCGLGNWFDARATCRHHAMDLAPPDRNILRKFTDTHFPSILPACRKTWIGLYRDVWNQIKPLRNAAVTIPLWAPGQPDNKGSCAILRWLDDQYFLIAADCNSTHEYICQIYPEKEADTTTTKHIDISTMDYNRESHIKNSAKRTPSPDTSLTRKNINFILSYLFLVLSIIIFTTIIIFLLGTGIKKEMKQTDTLLQRYGKHD